MEIKEALLRQQWKEMMEGEGVIKETIRLKNAEYFMEVPEEADQEMILMEIYTAEAPDKRGYLNWQTILLNPIKIKDEYNMSPGFFHVRRDSQDYYWCESGEGLLMMMDREGKCWCEELEEGSLHHVEEDLAVRLINIGDTPLIVSHCYPAEAGLDYDAIKAMPFPCHIYDDDGELSIQVDIKEEQKMESDADITFEEAFKS